MFEELKAIILNYVDVDPEKVTNEARFIEDLGFTSFDFMSMVGELEDTFDIEVNEREIVNVHSVADAIEYIKSHQ